MQRIKTLSEYFKKYELSEKDPEKFWSQIADSFLWKKKWDNVLESNFENADFKWFKNAQLNITENIFERNLSERGDKTAIIWEPNDPEESPIYLSYKELEDKLKSVVNAIEIKKVKKDSSV